ncbi:MAG TPA: hypothetical protein VHO48_07860 [Anaerolineaceae bacterium]|nr:hypothetical protein [Anaerolineaceae bacterium]
MDIIPARRPAALFFDAHEEGGFPAVEWNDGWHENRSPPEDEWSPRWAINEWGNE